MRFSLLPLLLLLLSTSVFSQRTADVETAFTEFDKKNFDAMQMTLDAEPDRVMDLWDEFWDERYDIDVDKIDRNKTATTYLAEQVSIPIVSDKNFNLFSKIAGTSNRSTLSMAIAFSDSDAVTKERYPKSYQAAEAIMTEFRTYFYTKYFDAQLAEARGDVEDIRDDEQDASKDAEKARKKIEKYQDKIEKLERKIADEREKAGEEIESADEKARKARDMESRVREIERMRAKYIG